MLWRITLMASHAKSPSLAVRLVVGYTLAAAGILTGSAIYLYQGLKQAFIIEDTELLSDQLQHVRRLLAKPNDGLEQTKNFIASAAGERELEKYYGRLLDPMGGVVAETPGMERMAPSTAGFPPPSAADQEMNRINWWPNAAGQVMFLGAGKVRGPDGQDWLLQLVLDARHVDEWLADYRRRLSLMIGMGTLLTAAAGYVVTRRGLAPLREITHTVQTVTAADLEDRLGNRPWPKELAVLADEFDHMLTRLRESFTRLSRFSADVAHELRTPLGNLLGATGVSLAKPRDAGDYRAALEANVEQIEELQRLVDSLLFIARADNAEAVIKPKLFDAAKVVGDLCDYFSALVEEKGLKLDWEGEGQVYADETLFRTALSNLVANAVRHTPAGGRILARIEETNAGCTIAVSDTGAGIPPEHVSNIFERFYQVDPARSTRGAGAGLGLAIVKSILKSHGGAATVESRLHEGSCFRLFFPRKPDAR
jgi:two-component system heavy metal sensor histidine kinase CusS